MKERKKVGKMTNHFDLFWFDAVRTEREVFQHTEFIFGEETKQVRDGHIEAKGGGGESKTLQTERWT